jgi:hypothetical protein
VKLPCGRRSSGAAVYTPHDGHSVRTVDPGHNPDGDTANHAELVAIHAAIADAGSRPASPNRHGCAAAIDQIINVVHQPAKLTFHRHRALLNAFTTFWKREQTGNKAHRAEGGRPLGRHRTVGWRQMGSLSDSPTTSQPPKAALGERRYRVAVPRSTTNDPETLARTRNRKPTHNTDTRGPETLAQHRGRDRATHAHAPPPRSSKHRQRVLHVLAANLGDTEGTISNAYPRRVNHTRKTLSSIGMVGCGTTSWHSRYKFSDTDKCPLCHQTDGGGHIASGCQDPIMKRMYTERHNKAGGESLLDAIYNGARGRHLHGRRREPAYK